MDNFIIMGILLIIILIVGWVVYIRSELNKQNEYDDILKQMYIRDNMPKRKGFKGDIYEFIAGDIVTLDFILIDKFGEKVTDDTELKYILTKHGKPDNVIFEKFSSTELKLLSEDTSNLKGRYDLFINIMIFDEYNVVKYIESKKMQLHIIPKTM